MAPNAVLQLSGEPGLIKAATASATRKSDYHRPEAGVITGPLMPLAAS
jgi:hypothetical protein